MVLLIRNVQLFDGDQLHNSIDLLIVGNRIAKIAENIMIDELQKIASEQDGELKVIDGQGKLLCPGFIDMHVHLREPGFEYKETIATGSEAAAAGGFTTICSMPNTKPVTDNKETVQYILDKALQNNGVAVYPIGAITYGERGEQLTNFSELLNAGIIALSDDGRGVQNSKLMQEAFDQAKQLNIPVIIHAEDESLVEGGHIHDGVKAREYQIKGIPSTSESVMVARDILLAEQSKTHVHFAHLSAKQSVLWIERAKELGIHVTCEVTPQHLVMCDEDIPENHGNYKVNPPIRSKEDQKMLIEGLRNGTIDMIATDHAPHSAEEKNNGIEKSYFGMVGLETAFPVLYTKLVQTGEISITCLLKAMTKNPAKIFNIERGTIEVDKVADLVLIDLQEQRTVTPDSLVSKGKNSPFINWELCGWPVMTMVSGKIIYQSKEVL